MGARKLVVGVTGASGAPYARRLLSVLAKQPNVELGCANAASHGVKPDPVP